LGAARRLVGSNPTPSAERPRLGLHSFHTDPSRNGFAKEALMEGHRGSRPAGGGEYSGWIAFAGMMMVILGSLDALWGLAAILNNEIVVVGGRGALIFDIT